MATIVMLRYKFEGGQLYFYQKIKCAVKSLVCIIIKV